MCTGLWIAFPSPVVYAVNCISPIGDLKNVLAQKALKQTRESLDWPLFSHQLKVSGRRNGYDT
jgi:hypothetical protein